MEEVTAAPSRLGVGGGGGEHKDSVGVRDKALQRGLGGDSVELRPTKEVSMPLPEPSGGRLTVQGTVKVKRVLSIASVSRSFS